MKKFTTTKIVNTMKVSKIEIEVILENHAYADVEVTYIDETTSQVTATCYGYMDLLHAERILEKWAK